MSQLKVEPGAAFPVPQITETDLFAFHEAHFGGGALHSFSKDFFNKDKAGGGGSGDDVLYDNDEAYYYYEEDDDLGYYPDGVKRTLTDEQIAMFRHSEMQALEKTKAKAEEKAQGKAQARRNTSSPIPMDLDDSSDEDGEILDHVVQPAVVAKKKKKNKKKKRGSGNGNKRWEPDPERRKRTWDVVETGLDGLDYGETDWAKTSSEQPLQRRRITYDDDG